MTFLEAAIEVLRQHGRPLSVHELTERAIRANLLSHTGRAPEETMQSRLVQEVKKGERTPLVQKAPGMFGLKRYDPPAAPAAAPAKVERAEKSAKPEKRSGAEAAAPAPGGDDAAKKRRRRRGGRGRKRGAPGEGEGTTSAADSPTAADAGPELGTPEEAIVAEQLALEAEAPAEAPVDVPVEVPASVSPIAAVADADATLSPSPDGGGAAALDAFSPIAPRRYPRIIDLPADEVLSAQYADEVAEGGVAAELPGEMVDHQTADEDRPMLAEIKDERDRRGRRRERDGKRKGKDAKDVNAAAKGAGKDGKDGKDGKEARDAVHAGPAKDLKDERHVKRDKVPPPTPAPRAQPASRSPAPIPAPAPAHAHPHPPAAAPETEHRRDDVAEVALTMLRSLNDPRPVHARQLAAMALKRKLLAGDLEETWRAIRSAIAGDARLRQAQGLRIRARHQGGGLITLTTARLEAEVRDAEETLEARWQELGRTTAQALVARAGRLPLAALEQLARIYLDHAGMRDVVRVKRHGETWFLAATQRRGARSVKLLVAVRAGGGESGRSAVGELRAGVSAKGVDEGLLLAPARLNGEGLREVEAAGPPVTAYTGEAFADELISKGVGVVRANLPLAYLDIDLLAELSES